MCDEIAVETQLKLMNLLLMDIKKILIIYAKHKGVNLPKTYLEYTGKEA